MESSHIPTIGRSLGERIGRPVAPQRTEEVAAVDINGAGELCQWIRDVPSLESLAARGDEPLRAATIEGVVLPAAVEADDSPHPVFVGVDRHPGRPDHVQDGTPIGRWSSIAWDPRRFLAPYAERFVDELVPYARRIYSRAALGRRTPPLPRPNEQAS
jgi:hypothetical protein